MSHTLRPSELPEPMRGEAGAYAYDMGLLHIILSNTMDIPNYAGRMLSISVKGKVRYPTVEEIAEVIVKVPEIPENSEWSMLWFGNGSISPTTSTVAYLFEGYQGRPMADPKAGT